jgi:hypothetical protein
MSFLMKEHEIKQKSIKMCNILTKFVHLFVHERQLIKIKIKSFHEKNLMRKKFNT